MKAEGETISRCVNTAAIVDLVSRAALLQQMAYALGPVYPNYEYNSHSSFPLFHQPYT